MSRRGWCWHRACKWHLFNEALSDTHSVTQTQESRIPRASALCIQQKLWGSTVYCLSICGSRDLCLSPSRVLLSSPHSPPPCASLQYFWVKLIPVSLPTEHKTLSILLLHKMQCPRTEPQQVSKTTSSQMRQHLLGAEGIALFSTILSPKPGDAHLIRWKGVQKPRQTKAMTLACPSLGKVQHQKRGHDG